MLTHGTVLVGVFGLHSSFGVLLCSIVLLACDSSVDAGGRRGPDLAPDDDAAAPVVDDGGIPIVPSSPDGGEPVGPDSSTPLGDGIAPRDAELGSEPAYDGENPIEIAAGAPTILRIDAQSTEHVGFMFEFAPDNAEVELVVHRWDRGADEQLALTNGGLGIRTLAVFDPSGPRTFWVEVRTEESALSGTLTVTRTSFEDGPVCEFDCATLMQFPVRNDPLIDGYDHSSGTIFRYQFGRRDLVMFVRYAARVMADLGYAAVYPEDFSQWDGATPGEDVGATRHVSHQRGKDVDISLYGADGMATWRHFCDWENLGDGRECLPDTVDNYDGVANAVHFAALFESGRITMSFLDQELEPYTVDGANEAMLMGLIEPEMVDTIEETLRHWPNHTNHIHMRVDESPYGASAASEESGGIGSSASSLTAADHEGC